MNSQRGRIPVGHGDIFNEQDESSMETHAEDVLSAPPAPKPLFSYY